MDRQADKTAAEICEDAILELKSEPAVANPEMYPVCAERNHVSAFLRFHGADSGNRLASSRMEVQGVSGALKLALARVRTVIGHKPPARRRVEPSDIL
jgi:hypothetical protein